MGDDIRLSEWLKTLRLNYKPGRRCRKPKKGIPASPKTIYGYVRVSIKRQVEEGHSIDAQIVKISDYCAREHLPTPVFMVDEGISGSGYAKRQKFKEMIELLKPGDIIVTYSLSRIGRDTLDVLDFSEFLDDQQVKLVCLDKQIDTTTIEGKMFFTIMASLNTFEREQTAERTSAVMQEMSRTGALITRAPFGKRLVKSAPGEKAELVSDPGEQRVLQEICILLYTNPHITDAAITRAIQDKVNKGELVMRRVKSYKPESSQGSNGKRVHQWTIHRIIRDNMLRDIVGQQWRADYGEMVDWPRREAWMREHAPGRLEELARERLSRLGCPAYPTLPNECLPAPQPESS